MARENTKTPTMDILDRCKLELCHEKVALKSEKEAKMTDYLTQKDIEQRYKVCCLVKAEATNKLYRHIDYQVGVRSNKEAKLLQDKVKGLGGMYDEMNGKLKDLVKKIRDTKKKMEDAVEAAEKLDRCIDEEERCNPDLFQILGEVTIETPSGDYPPNTNPPTPGEEIDIWTFINNHVKAHTDTCYDKILLSFDASIEVSGIMTFINIGSMSPGINSLATLIGNFKKDVEGNIKSSTGSMDEAIKDMTATVEKLTETRYAKCDASTKAEGVQDTYDFLCDPGCENKDGEEELQRICTKLQACVPEVDETDNCEEDQSTARRGGRKRQKSDWDME